MVLHYTLMIYTILRLRLSPGLHRSTKKCKQMYTKSIHMQATDKHIATYKEYLAMLQKLEKMQGKHNMSKSVTNTKITQKNFWGVINKICVLGHF